MKKINILLLFLSAIFMFSACSKDEDKMYALSGDKATAPTLTVEGATSITVTEDTYEMYPSILNWSKANFGKDVIVEYVLQMDTLESYQTAKAISLGNNVYSKALSGETLSDWAIKSFGAYDEDKKEVRTLFFNMRIIATVALESSSVINYPDSVYSNSISLEVTPYYAAPAYPENMYMIGQDFGGWDWNSAGIAQMIPVNGLEGTFWTIRYFTAANGFKWCAVRDWKGDFFELDTKEGYTVADNNAFVPADGLYIVYMDMPNGKITIEAAKVYGMGDCFGGWDAGKYPFTATGNKMTITTTASGDLRMYAAFSKASTDWWTREFILRDGVIEYRGNGGDQEPRVNVGANKTVTLDFNAGTGTIQ